MQFKTRAFDFLEITPSSSPVLKAKLSDIIDDSDKWNAAIESVDTVTGTYRIILQGKLRPSLSEDRKN